MARVFGCSAWMRARGMRGNVLRRARSVGGRSAARGARGVGVGVGIC